MNLGSVHDRFFIGAGHAQVKGGDGFCADFVLSGYIDAGLKPDMVYGEACDLFHKKYFLSELFFQAFNDAGMFCRTIRVLYGQVNHIGEPFPGGKFHNWIHVIHFRAVVSHLPMHRFPGSHKAP